MAIRNGTLVESLSHRLQEQRLVQDPERLHVDRPSERCEDDTTALPLQQLRAQSVLQLANLKVTSAGCET